MRFLNYFSNKYRKIDQTWVNFNSIEMDLLTITGKNNSSYMGIVFDNEALILDYKRFSSFRVKSGNLGFGGKITIAKLKEKKLNKKFLAEYFSKNNDNPYALYNAICAINNSNIQIEELTQFPPMYFDRAKDRKIAFDHLVSQARKGDSIFSSFSNNGISTAIRHLDRGQFSHVAPYIGENQVIDVGPDGGHVNPLKFSDSYSCIALYRLKGEISDDDCEKAIAEMKKKYVGQGGYPYHKLFLTYFRKEFRIPLPYIPSVSDLLYSNNLELICYA
jgi:hypothetical protein